LWNGQPDQLGRFEIDHQLELGRLLDGLEVRRRLDEGDGCFEWRVRTRPTKKAGSV
jgi:hypothetical protein